jgi:hypothetical protein
MSKLASIIGVAAIVATPASAGWRDQSIEGSSAEAFERSVALLLNELPRRRREDFEIALAFIWLSNTADVSGDLDLDGDADSRDVRLLKDAVDELLAAISRRDVVAAIEDWEDTGRDYSSLQYFNQLDGLQFDDVVNLAGRHGNEPSLARTAIERLDFTELSPYECSRGQHILAQISYRKQDYSRTREHLQKAIDAGGLGPQEASEFQRQIDRLADQLAAIPPPE